MNPRMLAALALIAGALLSPSTAAASFPGGNGALVLGVEGCSRYKRYVATMPWRGGDLTALTEPCQFSDAPGEPDSQVYWPDASADGRRVVAYGEETPYGSATGPFGFFTTMNADGSDQRRFAPPAGIGRPGAPSFAPSGRRFAYHVDSGGGGSSIWESRADGSASRVIRRRGNCGPQHRSRNCSVFLDPRWSPNGRLLAVVVETRVYDLEAPVPIKPGIWLMRADTGRLVRRVAKHGGWVDWSPDGRLLVYGTQFRQKVEGDGGASGGNLYVVDRRGRHTRQLVHREDIADTEPTWSPDGRRIAFVPLRFGFRIRASLWRVPAAGGEPRRVTGLPSPEAEEGFFHVPTLSWLPRAR